MMPGSQGEWSAARLVRERRGWSREKVAAAADVSVSTVWRLEKGSYPRVEHLVAIADALDLTVDQLLGRAAIAELTGD